MNKIKIGLNFKILGGIIVLLILCTVSNLIYSYNLFISDKTSYIYETGLKKTEVISFEIKNYLNSIKTKSQTYSFLFNLENFDFPKYLAQEKEYIAVGIVDYDEITKDNAIPPSVSNLIKNSAYRGSFEFKDISQIDDLKALLFKELKNIKNIKDNSFNEAKFVANFRGQNIILALEKNQGSPIVFFSLIDLRLINTYTESDNLFHSEIAYLDEGFSKINEQNHAWLKLINYKNISKGTQELNIEGVNKLLSYTRSRDSSFVIASFINTDKAFGITQFLIIKTSLFALILLGVAIATGIYFSSTVTHPIEALTEKANQIARGDFNQEVEIETSDELSVLAITFNSMSLEIRKLLEQKQGMIIQLEDYSKNLEVKVEERTLELKQANTFMGAMINSLDQGLFVFNKHLDCHDISTRACVDLFGIDPLHHKFTEVLGINNPEELENISQWAGIMFSEMIPFESAIGLGPKHKINGKDFTDPDFRHIEINYYPMKDDDSKITSVVAVGTDKTTEILAIEKKRENENNVTMILKILNNKTHFKSFCEEVDSILKQFDDVFDPASGEIRYDLAMILFHTMNGGFGMYSLAKLQDEAREYESQVIAAKENSAPSKDYKLILKDQINSLKSNFSIQKMELDKLLGTTFHSGDSFKEISQSNVLKLRSLIESSHSPALNTFFYEEVFKEPVIDYFKAYEDVCFKAAEKTSKEFAGIEFINKDLKVDVTHLQEFFNVLIHLFRNCIDHGIETPQQRIKLGKDPAGKIIVSFEIRKNNNIETFYVNIQDNGSGISSEIIKKRYLSINPTADLSKYSEKDIINIIFDPFFSTRDEVSAFSGRGVGMSAIKEAVEKLHGKIDIDTSVGKGSSFHFSIPLG